MNTQTQTAAIQHIMIHQLKASATNPRKRFDDGKLRELADSIKVQGIYQPLLIRKSNAITTAKAPTGWPFASPGVGEDASEAVPVYEIVAGERRFRAAKIAGLTEVPCFIRELTDAQVLHAQVIENLQRDDLHPLEEAEGYAKMMKEFGATAESLAEEISKSKAYIYARLKFIDLCQEARDAFFNGQMDASTALLIARIPVQKLQIQAVKEITRKLDYSTANNGKGDNAMSYRKARDYIQDNFMLDLNRAPFDIKDASLSPKVGSCTDCKERTGNQPELFDDVSSKDVCTNPVCHAMKKTAHILAIQQKAEAEGNKVIIGKEAKKLMPDVQYSSHPKPKEESGLDRLDAPCPHVPGKTWEEALKSKKLLDPAKGVQKVLVENSQTHELVPTISIEAATKALREAGFEITMKQDAKNKAQQRKPDQTEILAKVELEKAVRQRLFETIHHKIKSGMQEDPPIIDRAVYRLLAEACFEQFLYGDVHKYLAKLYLPDTATDQEIDQFQKNILNLTVGEQFLLSIDCILSEELHVSEYNVGRSYPDQMHSLAAQLCIDAKALKNEVIAERKAASKKPAKSISTPSAAAQAQDKPATKKPKAASAEKPAVENPKSKAKRKAADAA